MHSFYANLKKCQFYKDEVQFLDFLVSAQGNRIEEKRIKAIKTWPEPKSVKDIPVFPDFANLYKRFIKNFSKIAALLTSMLQTINVVTKSNFLNIRANENK